MRNDPHVNMGAMPPRGRRWYLNDDLRAVLRAKVVADEGYDKVGKRVGTSGPNLHSLLHGKIASSTAVPALCKLYGIDPLEHLPLDEEQLEWLRILEELKAVGKDPRTVIKSFRDLVLPEPSRTDPPSAGRPGRARSRGTRE
jgi:hypothetical protein